MPTTVDVPNVGLVEFPDSMSEGDINGAIQSHYKGLLKTAIEYAPQQMLAADRATRMGLGAQDLMQQEEERRRADRMKAMPIGATAPTTLIDTRDTARGFGTAGRALFGVLADMGGSRVPTYPGMNVQQAVESVDEGEPPLNIEALARGEEMPAVSQRRLLPTPARALLSGSQGLIESLPKLAASGGNPLAAGLLFGSTEQGFDPKQAAIATALPFVGKYAGNLAEAIASKAKVSSEAALKWINQIGGSAGAASLLTADQLRDISKLPEDQRKDAYIDAIGNVASMMLLGGGDHNRVPSQIRTAADMLRKALPEFPGLPEPTPITEAGQRLRRPPGMVDLQQGLDFMRQGEPIRRTIEEGRVPPEAAIGVPTYEPSGLKLKGEPNATETRLQQRDVPVERPRDDEGGTPAEASASGGVQPAAKGEVVEAPSTPKEQDVVQSDTLTPVVKLGDAQFTGESHADAINKAIQSGELTPDQLEMIIGGDAKFQRGFLTDDGTFIDRKQGSDWFKQRTGKEPSKPGELHSEDLRNMPKIIAKEAEKAEASAKLEPKPGFVRLYHGEGAVEGAGAGGSHFTEDPEYASQFGKVTYVDVPKDVADKARADFQKTGQGGKHFIIPDEFVRQAKPMETQPGAKVFDITPEEEPAISGPESGKLFVNPIVPALKPALDALKPIRGVLGQRFANMGARHAVDQLADAADNKAKVVGQQAGKWVEQLARDPAQDVAGSAAIAVGFDPSKLPALLNSVTGKNADAEAGIKWAMQNWPKAEAIGRRGAMLFDTQLKSENTSGIQTLEAENYLPGIADTDLWMGNNRPYVIGKSSGSGASFKKGKTYANPFEAIAQDAYKPQTLRLSQLVEHRLRQGQMMINRRLYGEELKNVVAPSDGKPVVTDLERKSRGPGLPGYEVAPPGYVAKELLPGVRVAVHEDFSKLFDAVTGQSSKIAEFEPGGIPVGQAALQAEGLVKHGLLVFDTFHASRILQKQFFLTGKPTYRKGASVLEYPDAALNEAVKNGEITQDMANYARANRTDANLLLKSGLNVGRVQEAMYSGIVRGLQEKAADALRKAGVPERIAEKVEFNKWVFEKVTRGAMLEGALHELDRLSKAQPDMPRERVAMKVARDLNAYFGNLGRQGVFKSPTLLDASRLAIMAPQWVESMARSEILGAGQIAKGIGEAPFKRRLVVGSLGSGLAKGLLAYVAGTQLLNLITRKQFTWQNPEKGHKLDAWVPDATGKTKGFFLSPLSVPAELTHDLVRYYEQSSAPNDATRLADAANKIRSNKMSPLWRSGSVLMTGRDYNDQKLPNVWDRVKASAVALAPLPIPLSPLKGSSPPGQTQRQITASLGLKTEPAQTANQQISSLARDWMRDSKDLKVQNKYQEALQSDFGESAYRPLKTALQKEDYDTAATALKDLVENKGKTLDEVSKTLRDTGADYITPKPVPGLSRAESSNFLRSLTPDQKKLWDETKKERKELYQRYLKLRKEIKTPQQMPKEEPAA